MKQMSTVTTVIIAAAVLVAAYAIGLLVREIRMGHAPTGEDVAVLEHGVDPHRPGTGEPRSVKAPNPSETREERAKALKKMSNLTEEEKQRFRDQVRDRVSPSGGERNHSPIVKQREEMMQKLQNMLPEERKAFEARMQRRLEEAPAQQPGASPDANQPQNATVEQGVKEGGSKTKGAAENPTSKSNQ